MFSSILALSCILAASTSTIADAATVRMTSESSCPSDSEFAAAIAASDSDVRHIVGVSDTRVCSVSCASWDLCAVSRFVSSSRSCQLATQTAWLRLWRLSNDTGCVSLIRPPIPPPTLFSKLLALYNFRFGSDNMAAGNPNALPNIDNASTAVRKPRDGFSFDGSSYVQVNLSGQPLSSRLSVSNKKIAFFAKVSSFAPPPYDLHTLYNRSQMVFNPLVYSGKWCFNYGKVTFEARDLSNFKYLTLTQPAGTTPFSTAVSFDASGSGVRFYYNGSAIGTASPESSGAIYGDEILRIGSETAFPFSGIVHCYVVVADTLELSDVWQLDQIC